MATFGLVRAALPGMLAADDGTIITVASLVAFSGAITPEHIPPRTLYAAAKAAIVAFTRTSPANSPTPPSAPRWSSPAAPRPSSAAAHRPRPTTMSTEGVVQASLAGLRLGETICIPGLEDQSAALVTTEAALMFGGNQPTPATRYQQSVAN